MLEDAVQMRSVYVDPAYWRKGVGTELIEDGLYKTPDGLKEVHVEVLAENEQGREFYNSLGFKRYSSGSVDLAGRELATVRYVMSLSNK